MRNLIWLALLLPFVSLAQEGIPDDFPRHKIGSLNKAQDDAAELNRYLSNGLLKMTGHISVFNRVLYPCGQYRAYGCSHAVNADRHRYRLQNFSESLVDTALFYLPDSGGEYVIATIGSPSDGLNDVKFKGFGMYRWVLGEGHVYVNSCDNPETQYVARGERAESRLALDNGFIYGAGEKGRTVNLRDRSVGKIRFSTGAEKDLLPYCEMTNLVVGEYDAYPLVFTFDSNAPEFRGPWQFTLTMHE